MLKEKETVSDEFCWHLSNPEKKKVKDPQKRSPEQNSNPENNTFFALGITYIDIYLGGGFKYFLFSSLPGEMIQFD